MKLLNRYVGLQNNYTIFDIGGKYSFAALVLCGEEYSSA